MKDYPFMYAALFLIVCGWIAIAFAGCGGPTYTPDVLTFCAGEEPFGPVDGAVQPSTALIINGSVSTDRRGTARVFNKDGSCTGTVIGPHTVYTAAHCLGELQSVHVDDVRYEVTESLEHPDYIIYPYDDLALLYVAEVLPEPYIELYDFTRDAGTCVGFLAQGWGQGGGGYLTEKPYEVLNVGVRLLVTNGDNGSTCFGDSGGPLYAIDSSGEPRLAGSVSTGWDYDCFTGGHHVRVDYYSNWIQENTY